MTCGRHRCVALLCSIAASQIALISNLNIKLRWGNDSNRGIISDAAISRFLNRPTADQCVADQFNNSSLVDCREWIYDKSVYTSTFVSEVDMVCSKSWQGPMFQSVYFLGILVGLVSHWKAQSQACFFKLWKLKILARKCLTALGSVSHWLKQLILRKLTTLEAIKFQQKVYFALI